MAGHQGIWADGSLPSSRGSAGPIPAWRHTHLRWQARSLSPWMRRRPSSGARPRNACLAPHPFASGMVPDPPPRVGAVPQAKTTGARKRGRNSQPARLSRPNWPGLRPRPLFPGGRDVGPCLVCRAPGCFGFVEPGPRSERRTNFAAWACADHRAEVRERWRGWVADQSAIGARAPDRAGGTHQEAPASGGGPGDDARLPAQGRLI